MSALDVTLREQRAVAVRRTPPVPIYEAVVLFACALKKDGAEALLEGLVSRWVEPAKEHLRELARMEAPPRRALVASTFGLRRDVGERLRALFAAASEELAVELHRQLPAHQKGFFSVSKDETAREASPQMRAFATRLLAEAMN